MLVNGPVQWPVGPFYLSLPPWLKPFITPLIITIQNKKCKKDDILTFLDVLGDYFISHEKIGHVVQKNEVWQHYLTMLPYAICANLSKADGYK